MTVTNSLSPPAVPAGSDLRSLRRLRCFKGAKIVFNAYQSVIDCTVKDMTQSGARLRISTTTDVPGEFELYLPQERLIAHARLAWQLGRDCGVSLVESLRSAPLLRRL
jgi:hypothetical protein